MVSHVKFVFCVLIIITIFPGRMFWGRLSVPQELISLFFPKNPGIVKVRTMEEIRKINGEAVLDFVSATYIVFNPIILFLSMI